MIAFTRQTLQGANCRLSIVEMGNPDKPPLVLIHGTHDHALGMVPAVAGLLKDYRVIGLDLRGHGHSEKPGNYSLQSLVADLRAIVSTLDLDPVVLIGHSLGGVVASVFAALYPDEVSALVLIDGMGPPGLEQELTAEQRTFGMRMGVESALREGNRGRTMASVEEARSRFARNNPALDAESVAMIADEGVVTLEEGGVRWRFDTSIDLIFATYQNAELEKIMSEVACPVLLLIGNRALDFWRQVSPLLTSDPEYFAAEQRRREQLFRQARLEIIADAGHSVHYDAPLAVQSAIAAFLGGAS